MTGSVTQDTKKLLSKTTMTPSPLLYCRVFMFQIFGLVHIHGPKLMALLFETDRCFSKPETFPRNTSYLEILSGEQAEMLVSMLSELSRLRVSKAWSL